MGTSNDRATHVPVSDLDELLTALVRRFGDYQTAAERYAARYGGTQESAERMLRRIREGKKERVSLDTVDKLCVLVGWHLSGI